MYFNYSNFQVFDIISSAKITGGNHYEIILYDEKSTVNFDFETNFPEYCDSVQMSELVNLFCKNDEDILEVNVTSELPRIIENRISEIENNAEVDDLESSELFFNMYGHALLGPVIYNSIYI